MNSVILRNWFSELHNVGKGRDALIGLGIAAPQGCKKTWDCGEVAMEGKEGGKKGGTKREGKKNHLDHINSPSGQLFHNWSLSYEQGPPTLTVLCPSSKKC